MIRPTAFSLRQLAVILLVGMAPSLASAQFPAVLPQTDIVEQLEGQLLSSPGAPVPEPGDQVAAFFGEQILAVYTFVSTQPDPLAWDMIIFGDNPDTTGVQEGPLAADPNAGVPGDVVTFQFFDASTNTIRMDVAPVSKATGEVITVTFNGAFTFQLPIPGGPGIPPFPGAPGPAIPFDLILGVAAPTPSGTGGTPNSGGGTTVATGGSPDVNGDGRVDKHDAAIVLRLVIGARLGVSEADAARADVNGDGVVDTRDAIAILSKRGPLPSLPSPGASSPGAP